MTTTSILEFPCEFTIKVFGKATVEYETVVLNIIRKYAADACNENSIKQRYSKGRNYLSLSITIQAQSKQQLDTIYQDLTQEPQVIMAL